MSNKAHNEPGLFTYLKMMWLEITLKCNEGCGHCYNASGKEHAKDIELPKEKWFSILEEGRDLGASEVQFIGGEPTLVSWLKEGLNKAASLGYQKIEIYTNGTKLDYDLLGSIVDNNVHVAVSVYSFNSKSHDLITGLHGSHQRTMKNIERLKEAGVPLRLSVVSMPINRPEVEETVKKLREDGFTNVGIDNVRAFGRALAITKRKPRSQDLCGHCWNGTFCINPQGAVYPCIMSRHLQIGDVEKQSLREILSSRESIAAKKSVFEMVWKPRNLISVMDVSNFPPYIGDVSC